MKARLGLVAAKVDSNMNPARSLSLCVNEWIEQTRVFIFFTTYTEARGDFSVCHLNEVINA